MIKSKVSSSGVYSWAFTVGLIFGLTSTAIPGIGYSAPDDCGPFINGQAEQERVVPAQLERIVPLEGFESQVQHLHALFDELDEKEIARQNKEYYIENGLGELYKAFGESSYALVSQLLPEKSFKPWMFGTTAIRKIWADFETIDQAPPNLQPYLRTYNIQTSTQFHRHTLSEVLNQDFANKPPESFYRVDKDAITINGLSGLIKKYDDSPFVLFYQLFPEKNLKPWNFAKLKDIWSQFNSAADAPVSLRPYLQDHHLQTSRDFQRHVLQEMLAIDSMSPDSLYELERRHFDEKGLSGLISNYSSSPFILLSSLYPEKDLKPWKFGRSLKDIWSEFDSAEKAPAALRAYLTSHELANSDQFRRHILDDLLRRNAAGGTPMSLYSLDHETLNAGGLSSMVEKYHKSVFSMVHELFPEANVKPWAFERSLTGIWDEFKSVEGAKPALQSYLKSHDLVTSDDFRRHIMETTFFIKPSGEPLELVYALQRKSFPDKSLDGLLKKYNGSPYMLVSSLYPKADIKPWKFPNALLDLWSDFRSVAKAPLALQGYLNAHHLTNSEEFHRHILQETFGILPNGEPLANIYKLTVDSFQKKGLITLLSKYDSSPFTMLLTLYPNSNIQPWKLKQAPNGTWSEFTKTSKAPKALQPYLKKHQLESSLEFQRHVLEETFGKDLSKESLEIIYALEQGSFSAEGASSILFKRFQGSPYALYSKLYDDKNAKPWKFAFALKKIWSEFSSIKKAPEALQPYLKSYGLSSSQDFQRHVMEEVFGILPSGEPLDRIYALQTDSFVENGLTGLLNPYGGSAYKLLTTLYPSADIKPWHFNRSLTGVWDEFSSIEQAPAALRPYLVKHGLNSGEDFQRHVLEQTFGISSDGDPSAKIYALTAQSFSDAGLWTMLGNNQNSPFSLLYRLYPAADLKPWKFSRVPSDTWSDFASVASAPDVLKPYLASHNLNNSEEFQRHVLQDTFGADFDQQPLEKIYALKQGDFKDKGLISLLWLLYGGSPYNLLSKLYPERGLMPWEFELSPMNIWSDFDTIDEAPASLRSFLRQRGLSNSLEFKRDALMTICREYNILTENECGRFLSKKNLIDRGIQKIQPGSQYFTEFMAEVFSIDKMDLMLRKKTQAQVTHIVKDLFGLKSEDIRIDYKSKRLFYTNPDPTGRSFPIEFDIYVPKLRLAVEVHGIQHFESVRYFGGEEAFKRRQERDRERRQKVAELKEKYGPDQLIFIEINYDETKNTRMLMDTVSEKIKREMEGQGLSMQPRGQPGSSYEAEFVL